MLRLKPSPEAPEISTEYPATFLLSKHLHYKQPSQLYYLLMKSSVMKEPGLFTDLIMVILLFVIPGPGECDCTRAWVTGIPQSECQASMALGASTGGTSWDAGDGPGNRFPAELVYQYRFHPAYNLPEASRKVQLAVTSVCTSEHSLRKHV